MIQRITLIIFSLMASPLAAAESGSAELEQGKKLHDAQCLSCHDTSMYTRDARKMTRYESLKTHVQRCVTNLDKQWFEDEVQAVAAYLNHEFYKFEEKADN
ncbi:MAG: cytochrome c [Pseudomonadota bacterium]|nr:cytochrome c [Pseudomonadota bacterium]